MANSNPVKKNPVVRSVETLTAIVTALTTLCGALLALDAIVARIFHESSVLYAAGDLGVRKTMPYPADLKLEGRVTLPQLGNKGGDAPQWFLASMDPSLQRDGWRFSKEAVVLGTPIHSSRAKHGSRCEKMGEPIVTDHYLFWRGLIGAGSGGASVSCVVPVTTVTIENRRSWLVRLQKRFDRKVV